MQRVGNILSKKKSTRVHTFLSLIYILVLGEPANNHPPPTACPSKVLQPTWAHLYCIILSCAQGSVTICSAPKFKCLERAVFNFYVYWVTYRYHHSLLFLKFIISGLENWIPRETRVTSHSSHILPIYHIYTANGYTKSNFAMAFFFN